MRSDRHGAAFRLSLGPGTDTPAASSPVGISATRLTTLALPSACRLGMPDAWYSSQSASEAKSRRVMGCCSDQPGKKQGKGNVKSIRCGQALLADCSGHVHGKHCPSGRHFSAAAPRRNSA